MEYEISHDLSLPQAEQVAHHALDTYAQRFARYSPAVVWTSDKHADISFTAQGVHLTGSLDVEPDTLKVRMKVPLLLRAFSGKAKSVIDSEVRSWIDRAKTGAL